MFDRRIRKQWSFEGLAFSLHVMKQSWSWLCAMTLFFAIPSCRDEVPVAPEDVAPSSVSVVTVFPEDLPVWVNLPGRLEAYLQAEVRARVTGIILKRCYREGQFVREGDLLFLIDPAPYEAAVKLCEARVREAEVTWQDARDKSKRYAALVSSEAVSVRERNMTKAEEQRAHAAYEAALAELEQARINLGYTRVTSPITGRVRRALLTQGGYVSAEQATQLTTVEQTDPIYVRFSQTAAQHDSFQRLIASGAWLDKPLEKIRARLVMPDGSEYPHEGTIFFADAAVDPETDAIEMRAEFPNPEGKLLPGSFLRVAYERAIRKQVYLVPRDALQRTAEGAFLFIVGDGNTLQRRKVEAESLHGQQWIVTAGLHAGERVVTSRPNLLRDGQQVRVKTESSKL